MRHATEYRSENQRFKNCTKTTNRRNVSVTEKPFIACRNTANKSFSAFIEPKHSK
uniref:Uncharacterized protein n=1 Tax=Parascaris univalens TaxID=6257 RepID=A0A915A585_PARUN